jgi:hypothetical protein
LKKLPSTSLEYGLDVLKMDGAVLFSNARGIYLGNAPTAI